MFSFLSKKKSVEPTEENLKISLDDNCILFSVNQQNQLIIKLSIQNLQESNAEKLAEVLFLMGHNGYKLQIAEMLQNMAEEDPDRALFIGEVMVFWSELVDRYSKSAYYKDDNPLISPSKFSQLVMNSESKNE